MTFFDRHREEGSVIVIFALVLPLLMVLAGGGVAGFGLFASYRELQRAADQAALAAAAGLPPFDPNILVEHSPYPLPSTTDAYELLDETGLDYPTVHPPRMRDLIPDPRSVACAVGSAGLRAESAAVTTAFETRRNDLEETANGDNGSEETPDPAPVGEQDPDEEAGLLDPVDDVLEDVDGALEDAEELLDGGSEADDDAPADPWEDTVCEDGRVLPAIHPNPRHMTPVECTNELVLRVGRDYELHSLLQEQIDSVVRMPLEHVLPAAFTPRVRVSVRARISPPLLSFIMGSDGGRMTATAVAQRRLKNAVVVPILPSQELLIETGELDPVEVMTDPVNLNNALHNSQTRLLNALDDADERLTGLMAEHGLPCRNLLGNLRHDLHDIYDPPTGPAPTARQLVDAAIDSGERAAYRLGVPEPDPENPDSLAGQTFLLIGVSVDHLMEPLAATQTPILDAALVTMQRFSDGSVSCAGDAEPPDGLLDEVEDTVDPIVDELEGIVDDLGDEVGDVIDPILEDADEQIGDLLEEGEDLVGGTLLGAASSEPFELLELDPIDPSVCYTATAVSAANAHGAFRATLVE